MHVLDWKNFIIGYGVGLLLAFGLYHFVMKEGKVQDDFVYSRGFVEAIRVQNIWNYAKLNKSVAKYYLRNQHHKFVWLKTVLKNLFYLEQKPFNLYSEPCSVEHWIDGQIDYFKEKSKERHQKLKKLEFVEKLFYRLGLVVLVVMFATYIWKPNPAHGVWFSWHNLVLLSTILLMVATFIGEKYIKIEGYEEEIYHFNAMLTNFLDAKEALGNITKGSREYREIVYHLGLKALDENSKWVVLHDRMRAEPSLE